MKTIQVNFLYEKLLVTDEQSFAKKLLILCLICFIYNSLQSFLCIHTMTIHAFFLFFNMIAIYFNSLHQNIFFVGKAIHFRVV